MGACRSTLDISSQPVPVKNGTGGNLAPFSAPSPGRRGRIPPLHLIGFSPAPRSYERYPFCRRRSARAASRRRAGRSARLLHGPKVGRSRPALQPRTARGRRRLPGGWRNTADARERRAQLATGRRRRRGIQPRRTAGPARHAGPHRVGRPRRHPHARRQPARAIVVPGA